MLNLNRFVCLLGIVLCVNLFADRFKGEDNKILELNEMDLSEDNLIGQKDDQFRDLIPDDRTILGQITSVQYILYVRPGGELGLQLRKFWSAVKKQNLKNPAVLDYPPHCSLTGFFPGSLSQEDDYISALRSALKDKEPISIQITSNTVKQGPKLDYIPLDSPDLFEITTEFVKSIGIASRYIKAQPGTFGYHISLREDTTAKTTTSVRKLEKKYIHLNEPDLEENTTWALYIYRKMYDQLIEVVRIPIKTK